MIEQLLTKNGMALVGIAKILMGVSPGDRIPKISELAEKMHSGRGTVQVALKRMEELGAIKLESRGHQGTFLIEMDLPKMWQIAAFEMVTGAMPLPYSKRYEGLATGLYSVFEEANVPFSLAYMRGAESRIKSLLNKRYDFILISRYAAKKAMEEGTAIEVVLNFGVGTYLSAHTLLFADKSFNEIQDGMRVGLDFDSIDQRNLTYRVCEGKNVEYVKLPYTHILSSLQTKKIDACVFNGDEVQERFLSIKQVPIPQSEQSSNTEAVIVVRKEDADIFQKLFSIMNVSAVLNIQKQVMNGEMYPRY
ncbi:GntR family transcriptional regulator YhfZ [Brevibacillus massiliensis]|uniref:GntR family transcriptional regulator YhfZ n=1 Tax=Brevibacillus massiliensis TaxID=1118054 RepID=UPI0003053C2A|nr:GntR family transcriptional regulator YhfZ [Brevibacillus massiliensis]